MNRLEIVTFVAGEKHRFGTGSKAGLCNPPKIAKNHDEFSLANPISNRRALNAPSVSLPGESTDRRLIDLDQSSVGEWGGVTHRTVFGERNLSGRIFGAVVFRW